VRIFYLPKLQDGGRLMFFKRSKKTTV